MFKQTELSANILKNNQLPSAITFTSQIIQDVVRLQFRNENNSLANRRPIMLTSSYVNQLSKEIEQLVNNELYSIRTLIKNSLTSSIASNGNSKPNLEEIIAIMETFITSNSASLIEEKIRVEIKIPFRKCKEFKDFFLPISQLFIPIAEYVEHFEIRGRHQSLYHLHAFLTFSKEELLYVCENPIEPCQKTTKEWAAFLLKIYKDITNNHTITYEIDCMDGKLLVANNQIIFQYNTNERMSI